MIIGVALFLTLSTSSTLAAGKSAADTVVLNEVVKLESRDNQLNGSNSLANLGKPISKLIAYESSVYIKNYGNNQLATIAVRGTSATQSEVQWNGIKLNNPMLGMSDLSLFQTGLHESVSIFSTGFNGNIGATIAFNNALPNQDGVNVNGAIRIGSFESYDASVNASYYHKHFGGSTKFLFRNSKNNFEFRNSKLEGNPRLKITNADYTQWSLMQHWRINLPKQQQFNAYFWYNNSNRNLPPTMTKMNSRQSQLDANIRGMINWKIEQTNFLLSATSAVLFDKIIYNDPALTIADTTATIAYRNNIYFRYQFKIPLKIAIETGYDLETAKTVSYDLSRRRHIGSLKIKADYTPSSFIKLGIGLRQDVVDKKFTPFSPNLSCWFYKSVSNHQISTGITASRNFRVPTLNDLYWKPGGNPSLKTEKSWNAEWAVRYNFGKQLKVSVNAYVISIDDWIQWTPSSNGYWAASNVKSVLSRGVESTLSFNLRPDIDFRKLNLTGTFTYAYTKTTNTTSIVNSDNTKGKQLIYVPLHQGNMLLQLSWRQFYARVTNTVVGKTFFTSDNSIWLKPYVITGIELGKQFQIRNQAVSVNFNINNIANTQYQVVSDRPMPGRSYELTVTFNLNP